MFIPIRTRDKQFILNPQMRQYRHSECRVRNFCFPANISDKFAASRHLAVLHAVGLVGFGSEAGVTLFLVDAEVPFAPDDFALTDRFCCLGERVGVSPLIPPESQTTSISITQSPYMSRMTVAGSVGLRHTARQEWENAQRGNPVMALWLWLTIRNELLLRKFEDGQRNRCAPRWMKSAAYFFDREGRSQVT